MADENNEGGKPKIAQNNVVLQGHLVADPKIHSEKFATMRIAVSNDFKKEDGTWTEGRPASFFDLKVNGTGPVSLLKEAVESGKAKTGAPLRFEGFPVEDEYQGKKSIAVVARKGATAFSFDKPEPGKGKANDFTITGSVGRVEAVEGEKNGKPFKFYKVSVADNDRDGKATWYNAVVSAPKSVAALEAGQADGSFGVGALITLQGSMEPNTWEKDGVKQTRMELKVKPFEDSLKVVFPAKNKDAAKGQEDAAKAPEAEAPKKAGGKKKAAAAKGNRNLDDEIPF